MWLWGRYGWDSIGLFDSLAASTFGRALRKRHDVKQPATQLQVSTKIFGSFSKHIQVAFNGKWMDIEGARGARWKRGVAVTHEFFMQSYMQHSLHCIFQ